MWRAVLLAFAIVPLGAAQPHPPQVAFKQSTGSGYAIVLADQTGTRSTNLTAGKPQPALLSGYSWAPDGSRLVYVGNEQTLGGDLEVLDVDAGTVDQITSSGANEQAVWSPDGSRIAYVHVVRKQATGPTLLDDDVWLVAPDGSGARRLTYDGGNKDRISWAPDGSSLIVPGGTGARIVDPDTGRVLRTVKEWPTFSPDGKRVVLVTAGVGMEVANADGSNRHRLASGGGGGPVWSPDGTRIAFSRSHCTPGIKGLCGEILHSIYVVGVEGGRERRLTGPIAGGPGATEDGFPHDFSSAPVWWPDGKQLFFTRDRAGTMVMNADGTCEHRFGPPGQDVSAASWRPGANPTVAPLRCVDLRVRAVPRKRSIGVHEPAVLDVVVENDGNGRRPASGSPCGSSLGAARSMPRASSGRSHREARAGWSQPSSPRHAQAAR